MSSKQLMRLKKGNNIMLGFGYNLINTPQKIQNLITSNRRLQQTKFYVGKIPAVTLSRQGNTFVANGFLPKHTQLRIPSPTIVSSNRMQLIQVKAIGRTCWLPLNKIGVKMFNISFRKTNDTFIDTLNADIEHFMRLGIQPKLYLDNNNSNANLVFFSTMKGYVSKNKKNECKYSIEGLISDQGRILRSVYIRVIEDAIDTPKNERYYEEIVKYLSHFTDQDKKLTTNVAYILPDNVDYGTALYGKGYTNRSSIGSPTCADFVFYGAPAIDTDELTGSIILKSNNPNTATTISYINRHDVQPPASNFCYLAMMKAGKSIWRPKRIKDATIQFTFTSHIENNPNIIKKGQTIGPVPPGAGQGA